MADATLSDRLVVEIAADMAPLSRSLAQAGRDVNQFASGTVGNAARSMSGMFGDCFGTLEKSVTRAARTGQISIGQMVNNILADLARVAVNKFVVPVANDIAGSLAGAISGLAVGGPVGPGSAYLVGERGPELFVPSGNGAIVPNGVGAAAPRPQIVLNVQTQDARSFLKSESQIAAMLTRAAMRGQKNL
jgi:phage-related minor tail protein